MSNTHEGAHDHEDPGPVTDHVHENSWSANLEQPVHADDEERIVDDAITAIDHTAPGYHVNLVTHGDQGHPESYLYDALEQEYGDEIDWEYVEQCGCGGHVVRVSVS